MENGSLISMIAGFLPPASTTPSSPSPPAPLVSFRRSSSIDTAGAYGNGNVMLLPAAGGDGAEAATAVPRRRVVHMICFSKNRAFQLDQLLESSKRHLRLVQEENERAGEGGPRIQTPAVHLRVSVLYLASSTTTAAAATAVGASTGGKEQEAALSSSPPAGCGCRTMRDSYDLVKRRHPGVRFVRERPGEFCEQLCSLICEGQRGEESEGAVAAERTGDDGFKEGDGEANDNDEENFVLFAVDDMFFYSDFKLPAALRLLTRGE